MSFVVSTSFVVFSFFTFEAKRSEAADERGEAADERESGRKSEEVDSSFFFEAKPSDSE